MTALDIFVILLVGGAARVRLAARLRRRGPVALLAWFLGDRRPQAVPRAGRRAPDRRGRDRAGASVLAFALVFVPTSSAASSRRGGRRADPQVGGRAGRPRARRRLRRVEGPDRRDPALPPRQPRLRHDLGRRRRPARMDGASRAPIPCSSRAAARGRPRRGARSAPGNQAEASRNDRSGCTTRWRGRSAPSRPPIRSG